MNNILKIRNDSILNTQMRYSEGVMTRRKWIELQHERGARVEPGTRPKAYFNRTKYNRMAGSEQAEYESKCNERIPCYNLFPATETGFFEITCAEYEYFLTLLNQPITQ